MALAVRFFRVCDSLFEHQGITSTLVNPIAALELPGLLSFQGFSSYFSSILLLWVLGSGFGVLAFSWWI